MKYFKLPSSLLSLIHILTVLCLLLLPTPLHSLSYPSLLYQQQIPSHQPQCILTNQTINGIQQQYLILHIKRFKQQMLPPPHPQTQVFGFGCSAQDSLTKQPLGMIYSAPGPTIRAISNTKLTIHYVNKIKGQHLFKIDKTLIMDPYKEINVTEIIGVPVVIHAHGMIVRSTSDGYPGAYVTANGVKGPHYWSQREVEKNQFLYEYPLLEREATLWIHDHAIGITRLNVYAGLTSFLLIDPKEKTYLSDVPNKYDILINLQDRTFKTGGELFYPSKWEPEYFGKAIVVNGKVWPVMTLKAHEYRLRLLNSCGSRVLKLAFKKQNNQSLKFIIVKTDSSYLDKPVKAKQLLIFPGQRFQILIKFKKGQIQLINTAPTPYPDGDQTNPQTTGKVMKFNIIKPDSYKKLQLSQSPQTFQSKREPIIDVDQVRYSVFIQQKTHHSDEGRSLIDGHDMNYPYPNFINEYSYELNLINLTPDSHPFHIHLTQFEIVERKMLNSTQYQKDMIEVNGPAPWDNMTVIPLEKYLFNQTIYAAPYERALKDIVVVNPKEVIKVRFRFLTPQGEMFPFDVTKGPGYVWHCHILEHQDNSMMVAFRMQNPKISDKLKYFIIKLTVSIVGLALVIGSVMLYDQWKKRRENTNDTIPLKVSNMSQLEIQQPQKIQTNSQNQNNPKEDYIGSPDQLHPSSSPPPQQSNSQLN